MNKLISSSNINQTILIKQGAHPNAHLLDILLVILNGPLLNSQCSNLAYILAYILTDNEDGIVT